MKPGKQTFLKPCLTVLLLLWALLGVWSIRGLSPNVDWPLSDYSGYPCKIFIRPQENREWMRYNVSVDYTQQKFYIYDGQKGEWKPHDLLNEHPQYQIFMRIWGAQHKTIDTADNGQMTAPLLPLQNPTLISGKHGYRSDEEETPELFVVISQSKKRRGKNPIIPRFHEASISL